MNVESSIVGPNGVIGMNEPVFAVSIKNPGWFSGSQEREFVAASGFERASLVRTEARVAAQRAAAEMCSTNPNALVGLVNARDGYYYIVRTPGVELRAGQTLSGASARADLHLSGVYGQNGAPVYEYSRPARTTAML